jgi:hypothetical protein
MLGLELERRMCSGEQHLGSLGADKRIERSVTGIAIKEVCDLAGGGLSARSVAHSRRGDSGAGDLPPGKSALGGA